eukprot:COSAG02_NODE_45565_length_356_cov_0.599222_2_plen_81_part_01
MAWLCYPCGLFVRIKHTPAGMLGTTIGLALLLRRRVEVSVFGALPLYRSASERMARWVVAFHTPVRSVQTASIIYLSSTVG